MSKLTKQDKIHIFEEWTLEDKRGTYLSKKYGVNIANINYLVSLIKRKFFALRPNMKWYTDITEFNLKGKKLYLSPIIDGCGRDTVAYNISRHPNLKQVMSMLNDAFKTNQALNGLIFHTDRGWQYQHKAY